MTPERVQGSGFRVQGSGFRVRLVTSFHFAICNLQFVILPAVISLLGLTLQACADEPQPARLLVPVKGECAIATLISVSPNGEVIFGVERTTRSVALDEIVAWGTPSESRSTVQLLLADGGILPLASNAPPTTGNDRLLAFSDTFGEFSLPVHVLAGVMLHAPVDPQQRDRLAARLVQSSPNRHKDDASTADNSDRLFLENGDELRGRFVALTQDAVEFEAAIGPLTVELERVVALTFDPSLRGKPIATKRRVLVGFADGSTIAANSISNVDGRTEITILNGSRLAALEAEPVFLQPLVGQVEYISDLRSATYRHIPYLGVPWEYRLDANVDGTRLRAGGKLYLKGVGMHSAARLTWQIDKPYRRFEADLAIDDQTEGRGSVVFRVFSGSREIYKSLVVRGGEKPLPISVDIRNARQLSVVVDYADRADVLDHADWLNARLVP